jgi:hypothetical protein
MKRHSRGGISTMSEVSIPTENVGGKLLRREAKIAELRFLKRVVLDLRSYRKMIGVKNYD